MKITEINKLTKKMDIPQIIPAYMVTPYISAICRQKIEQERDSLAPVSEKNFDLSEKNMKKMESLGF